MNIDDEIYRRATSELIKAAVERDRAFGRYHALMRRCYADPDAAAQRLEKYKGEHGREGLIAKLSDDGHVIRFGQRPGSVLGRDFLEDGAAGQRKDAVDARRELPDAVRRYFAAHDRFKAALAARDLAAERVPYDRRRELDAADPLDSRTPEPDRERAEVPGPPATRERLGWSREFANRRRGPDEPTRRPVAERDRDDREPDR